MKELSVFIDESGDFGEYDEQTPYYIITMVFHEQSHSISDAVAKLDQELSYDGVNLLNASGECAGQSVPHFHVNIIPRRQNDQIDAWPEFEGAKEDITDVFNHIRMV